MGKAVVIILFRFDVPRKHVDHVHSDSIIAIAASVNSKQLTAEIFGEDIGWLPWKKPGYELGLWLEKLATDHPQMRGAVLESLSSSNVGARNAEFVLKFLQTEKIPVVAKDLLDSYPRKVYYFPNAGRVLVRKLHRVHNDTLFNREKEYKSRIEHSKVEGDIELFT